MTLSHILWIYCDDDKSAPVSLLYNRILSLCWTFCTITKRKSSVWFPCQKVLFAPRKTFFVIFHFFSLQQKVYNLPTTYLLLDRYYQIATAKSFSKKGEELFLQVELFMQTMSFFKSNMYLGRHWMDWALQGITSTYMNQRRVKNTNVISNYIFIEMSS